MAYEHCLIIIRVVAAPLKHQFLELIAVFIYCPFLLQINERCHETPMIIHPKLSFHRSNELLPREYFISQFLGLKPVSRVTFEVEASRGQPHCR